jgi:hypothetical protein
MPAKTPSTEVKTVPKTVQAESSKVVALEKPKGKKDKGKGKSKVKK